MRIEDALERAGKTVPRNGKLHCPAHNDKTPSLHLYPRTNSWTCFSCMRNGDGYGLYALLTGQDVADVLRSNGTKERTTAPKAQPWEMRARYLTEWTGISQPLFHAIQNADLMDWQKDLLLDRVSEWADEFIARMENAPLADTASLLAQAAEFISARIEEWELRD
jgi:hypothetical protein